MTLTEQDPSSLPPTPDGYGATRRYDEASAARLAEIRRHDAEEPIRRPDGKEDIFRFLLRLLEAAEARVAEFESGRAYRDSLEERDDLARRVAELEAGEDQLLAEQQNMWHEREMMVIERDRLAASLAAAEAALRPFAECDARPVALSTPAETYLWKAQNSVRETKGITMRHILDARAALQGKPL